jgi:uncharacterized membrane protein YgcG
MYRFLSIGFILCVPFFVSAESIPTFTTHYQIEQDGSVLVTERVTYDFESEERHGIFRNLLLTHPDGASTWYKQRVVELEVVSVTRDGVAEPYEMTGSTEREIKVGNADITMSGPHVYELTYRLRGAQRLAPDGTVELYWNVTGRDWPTAIAKVSFSASGAIGETASCYTTTGDCVMNSDVGGWSVVVPNLPSGEELTVGVSTTLDPSVAVTKEIWRTDLIALLLMIPMALGAIIAMYRYEYFYYRRRPIIAEYEPYEGIEPMFAGTLLDDNLGAHDITAGLIYLAEQGFVHIKRTERKVVWLFNVTDYELTLKRPLAEVPSEFLKKVLLLVFPATAEAGVTVPLSSIKRDTTRKLANSKTISELSEALRADLVTRGFMESKRILPRDYVIIGLFFVLIIFTSAIQSVIGIVWYLVLMAATILYGIYLVVTYRRRTAKGYEAMYHLKGFKEFLSVTDKERFDFHNAPERSPEQFMQYIPYAIAFQVEKKWAAAFADMEITTPDWYEGSTGTFAATAFASDISSFTSSVTSSTSASSGGGSAGGGGGGGGGGSW